MSNVMTPVFRASYPALFKSKLNDLNGEQEYSVVALFPKNADMSKLKAAAQAVIEEKWGKEKNKWPKNLKSPFRLQEEREKYDEETGKKLLPAGHEAGAIFMNLKSKQKPGLVNADVQDILDASEIYAGCYCRATVRPYAYEVKGNAGIAFGLQNVQKVKDGDPLSGRTKATDDFAPVGAEMSAPDKSATSMFD